MLKKKLNKIIGLKKDEFDNFCSQGQIILQRANLIPTHKTGDEMALTSIFLSTLKLVKEYRENIFKEIKLKRGGRKYYYTEVSFPEIDKSRIDGLVIVVISGKIVDATFFEMKNKNNTLELNQVETYIRVAKKLGINKLTTVSNEFVSDCTISPLKIKTSKNFNLFHFSWTYLLTQGQLLLFKNDNLIEDDDQIEIMKEVLQYLESPLSGVSGFTRMKSGWKELSDNIRAQKPIKKNEEYLEDAILSWYEEEKDMALLMSRKLGVLVKSSSKNKDSLKNDINKLLKENYLTGTLSVKNSVSDIKIILEFERRSVSMSIKISPPKDRGTIGKISWLGRQLENCKKKSDEIFNKIENYIWIEADIKYARKNLKVKLNELDTLKEISKNNEIQAFHIVIMDGFGVKFASQKKFIELIEKMVVDFYEGIVQYMTNWNQPAPKIKS